MQDFFRNFAPIVIPCRGMFDFEKVGDKMLVIVDSMRELNFRQLMDVYEELNLHQGRILFPHESFAQWPLLAEQDFHQYLRECFFPTPGAVYAVWQVAGRYVSALRLEPYMDGLLIEALETLPACRGMGYAGELLMAVKARYEKIALYAHVDKKNIPSIHVHERCGFYRIMEHALFADGSVLPGSCTYCSKM